MRLLTIKNGEIFIEEINSNNNNKQENVKDNVQDNKIEMDNNQKIEKYKELSKKELQAKLDELYMREYYMVYPNYNKISGKLRNSIIEADLRFLYNYKFGKTCLVDAVTLFSVGGLVFVLAPQYFSTYITLGSALVVTQLSLPYVYEKVVDYLDKQIIELRKKLTESKRKELQKEEYEIHKLINSK
ncbi:MAG: hypothetical protein ACI4TX_01395 [Christensenellales bacterium]